MQQQIQGTRVQSRVFLFTNGVNFIQWRWKGRQCDQRPARCAITIFEHSGYRFNGVNVVNIGLCCFRKGENPTLKTVISHGVTELRCAEKRMLMFNLCVHGEYFFYISVGFVAFLYKVEQLQFRTIWVRICVFFRNTACQDAIPYILWIFEARVGFLEVSTPEHFSFSHLE